MRWGAASTDSIVEEHAISLFNVKEGFNTSRFVITRIDMRSDWIDHPMIGETVALLESAHGFL